MFGKRKSSQSRQDPSAGSRPATGPVANGSGAQETPPHRSAARPATGNGSSPATANGREELRRPSPAVPQAAAPIAAKAATPARSDSRPGGEADDGVDASRKLVVGKGISLSGQIKTCEKLVVEGKVEANLTDCVTLEIAESGLFNGSAKVQDAEISGCFEGDLVVFGRLYLRSSGILEGTIKYADLEIERGGKIAGTVDLIDDPAAAAAELLMDDDEESDDGAGDGEAEIPEDAKAAALAAGTSADAAEEGGRQGRLKIS